MGLKVEGLQPAEAVMLRALALGCQGRERVASSGQDAERWRSMADLLCKVADAGWPIEHPGPKVGDLGRWHVIGEAQHPTIEVVRDRLADGGWQAAAVVRVDYCAADVVPPVPKGVSLHAGAAHLMLARLIAWHLNGGRA